MSASDIEFRKALHDFRREKTLARYGLAHLNNLGHGLIMGDEVFKRIADCARAQKLTSVESLFRETKWSRSNELGEELLGLVTR